MGPVSTWMGDCLQAGKPSRYGASRLDSAFYFLWNSKMSAGGVTFIAREGTPSSATTVDPVARIVGILTQSVKDAGY